MAQQTFKTLKVQNLFLTMSFKIVTTAAIYKTKYISKKKVFIFNRIS